MAVGCGCDGGLLWLVVMDCGFAFVFFSPYSGLWLPQWCVGSGGGGYGCG